MCNRRRVGVPPAGSGGVSPPVAQAVSRGGDGSSPRAITINQSGSGGAIFHLLSSIFHLRPAFAPLPRRSIAEAGRFLKIPNFPNKKPTFSLVSTFPPLYPKNVHGALIFAAADAKKLKFICAPPFFVSSLISSPLNSC